MDGVVLRVGERGGTATVWPVVPPAFAVTVVGVAERQRHALANLPPVHLRFEFPPDYPSTVGQQQRR